MYGRLVRISLIREMHLHFANCDCILQINPNIAKVGGLLQHWG
jgi:hypothetical protein